MSLQEKHKQSFINTLLRWSVFLAFLFFTLLSAVWLGLKIRLAKHLSAHLDFLSLFDIVRSHLALDIALAILLFLSSRRTLSSSARFASLLLFLLMTFYFLKLTGLYAYTYDATPWKMIEYGSYLLQVPFASNSLSLFAYLLLPFSLLIFISYKLLSKSEQNTTQDSYTRPALLTVFVLITIASIPPIQKDFLYSLAYHPYMYSVSGAFKEDKQNEFKENNITEINMKNKNQNTLEGINLVFVVLESFSDSTVNARVTPVLSELRQQSLNFSRAYSNIPHTSKALVNIFCGEAYLSPYLYESIYGTKENCLAQSLNRDSVFFQGITKTFENREALVNAMGFKDFYSLESLDKEGYEAVNYFSFEDDIVLPASETWLANFQTTDEINNNMLTVYLTGITHHNYQTPSDFKKLEYTSQHNKNDYLNAAHYVDQFVAKLLQQYQQAGLMNNTLFIFLGDHGEGFNDKQALMHNNNLFQSGLHIPLFIYNPALIRSQTVKTPFSQNQLKALLLSYDTEQQGFTMPLDKEIVISSCWYMDYCYAITKQIGDDIYKLIDDRRNKRQLLYNLSKDPDESLNQIEMETDIAQQLMNELRTAVDNNHYQYNNFFSSMDEQYTSKKEKTFSAFESVTHF